MRSNKVWRASDTINDVASAWVKDQSVNVVGGKITEYCVTLKVTFVLKAAGAAKAAAKAR